MHTSETMQNISHFLKLFIYGARKKCIIHMTYIFKFCLKKPIIECDILNILLFLMHHTSGVLSIHTNGNQSEKQLYTLITHMNYYD
jgi:hypothetical protein